MSELSDKTIYCDGATFKKLSKIAKNNDRTIIGQIRYWIKEDKG
jgi:hypothetical protein